MAEPVILANGEVKDGFIVEGMQALRSGARACDVAEQIARAVEDDPEEHTVGYGGFPNLLGEVELDASIMDGDTLHVGAVAGLKGFRHPISVARQVMVRLPHVLLVGEGAARFAEEIGAERRDMLSPEAAAAWRACMAQIGTAGSLSERVWRARQVGYGHDTMNVIVRDAHGSLCAAVTTSGVAWKYPGRVGDSPLIGAGNYCDSRYGAAACMGLGEAAIRLAAAAQVVTLLRVGWSLDAAGREVARQLAQLLGVSAAEDPMRQVDWERVLVMDADGAVGGFATRPGLHYKVQRAQDPIPYLREACFVDPS